MEKNDAAEMIGKILDDPETLSRLMSVASGIMGSMSSGDTSQPVVGASDSDLPVSGEFALPTAVGAESGGAQGGPDLTRLLTGLIGSVKPRKDDPRCALLYALRPYMSKKRADRIETLVKVLSVSELAEGLFSGSGLFS